MNKDKALELFEYSNGSLFNKVQRNSRALKGAKVSSKDKDGYLNVQVEGKKYKVHRIIWLMHNERWPEGKLEIDHINGIRDDNRIENLREVTGTQNNFNRKGVKGYTKRGNKYQAKITVKGRETMLGLFNTTEEAHNAYLIAKEKYHR